MAKPLPVEIPHHGIVKVASNINVVRLIKLDGSKSYYQTYRDAGDLDVPVLPVNLDNPTIPIPQEWVRISKEISQFESDDLSDVYIYCCGGDNTKSGYLRVGVLS